MVALHESADGESKREGVSPLFFSIPPSPVAKGDTGLPAAQGFGRREDGAFTIKFDREYYYILIL